MSQKSHIPRSQLASCPRSGFTKLLKQDGQNERTRVIVGGVALRIVGHSKRRVLEHACAIGQPLQVIQVQRW